MSRAVKAAGPDMPAAAEPTQADLEARITSLEIELRAAVVAGSATGVIRDLLNRAKLALAAHIRADALAQLAAFERRQADATRAGEALARAFAARLRAALADLHPPAAPC